MSVTSPHVPNEGKFPDQIDSGEVADQGWTDPVKRQVVRCLIFIIIYVLPILIIIYVLPIITSSIDWRGDSCQ